jgi:hypothetical protein
MEVDTGRRRHSDWRHCLQKVLEMPAEVGTVSTAWAVFSVIGGTLIGSTISTVVAFYIQKKGLSATKAQRDSDRFESRKAQCYSLLFKMIRIHSSIVILEKGLTESLAKAEAVDLKGEFWKRLTPSGNMPPRVKFTSDEMVLLLSLDFNLFNDIGPYDDIHQLTGCVRTLRVQASFSDGKIRCENDGKRWQYGPHTS